MRFGKISDFAFLNDFSSIRFFRFFVKVSIFRQIFRDYFRFDFSRFYYFTITILNFFGTSAVASYNIRLFSSHMGGCIDVADFDHKGMVFLVFCGYLLRIPLLGQLYNLIT